MSDRHLSRVRKDLQEYFACREEFPCIAAAPLENDICTWHINIKAPDGPYASSPVHFVLKFPPTYPMKPPEVRCMTPIQHPNLFDDGYVCLDLLKEHTTNEAYRGWSPGYTLTTILLQLQSFLFSENIPQEDYEAVRSKRLQLNQQSVQRSMMYIKNFRCTECGHDYDINFPAFPKCEIAKSAHSLTSSADKRNRFNNIMTISGLAAQNESSCWEQVMSDTFEVSQGKAVFEIYIEWIGDKWSYRNTRGGLARVGWGTKDSTRLGEDDCSIGYGGTAKMSFAKSFENFGVCFGQKDTITTCLDYDNKRVAFAVNGEIQQNPQNQQPWENISFAEGQPLYPISLFKNGRIVFNFDKPKYNVFGTHEDDEDMEDFNPNTTWSEHLPEQVFLDIEKFLTLDELSKCFYVCADWQKFIEKYSLISRREVQCYISKQTSKDALLGMCFEVQTKRDMIDLVGPRMDFISLEKWKTGHRTTLWGNRCTDILLFPINAEHAKRGEVEIFQVAREFMRKFPRGTYSFNGTSRNINAYNRELVPTICALMNACVLSMARDKNLSDRFLMCYSQLHHLLVYMADRQPLWRELANKNLKDFLNGPRNKKTFSNLGHFLPLLLLATDEFQWEDFIKVFTQELFARNVRWYANTFLQEESIPDERKRLEMVFRKTEISRKIVMFQISFLQMVGKGESDLQSLNSRLGQLSYDKRRRMMKRARAIVKCQTWKQYFQFCSHPIPRAEELVEMLKSAWDESLAQRYHSSRFVKEVHRSEIPTTFDSCAGLKSSLVAPKSVVNRDRDEPRRQSRRTIHFEERRDRHRRERRHRDRRDRRRSRDYRY